MSWLSNYLFGSYSDDSGSYGTSGVPDSYEHTLQSQEGSSVPDSYEYEQQSQANFYEQEVLSGYAGSTSRLPDLNETPQHVPDLNESLFTFQEYGYGCEGYYEHNKYSEYDSKVQENFPDDDIPVKREVESVDNEEDLYPITVHYATEEGFTSCKELVDWVKQRGLDNGYVIVTKRSKKKGDVELKVWLQCSLSGETKSVAKVRKTGSKKQGCPFLLVAFFDKSHQAWFIEARQEAHNHPAVGSLLGHAYARRLTPQEHRLVEELAEEDIPARHIWKTLTNRNPENMSVPKDIHNILQKLNASKSKGESPMQKLQTLLMSKRYTFETRENPETKAVEDVFFVHPDSFDLWRAFPHVLTIDATYKTNLYDYPFIQVVGMTPTNMSFAVCHAVVCRETQDTYRWVLQMAKNMLEDGMEPRVILTDRELSLTNACDEVFPSANKYLCRFHIQQNILKNSKKCFSVEKEWNEFLRDFSRVCESPSEQLYQYNLEVLINRLHEARRDHVVSYMMTNWFEPYHEKFVSAWTNRTINYHQTTTNRAESQHAEFKRQLENRRNTLSKIVVFVDHLVVRQRRLVTKSLEESRRKVMNHHREFPMLDHLLRKVSIYALEKLYRELNRKMSLLRTYGSSCGCQLHTSCGLPCACRIEKLQNTGKKIPLNSIDKFWTKLDLDPLKKEEEFDLDKRFNELKELFVPQPNHVRKNMFQKMMNAIRPSHNSQKPPVVQKNPRGRPSQKVQEQKKQEPATNIIEPSRHSSYVPSQQSMFEPSCQSSYLGSQQGNVEPSRHSSYFPSIDGNMPQMQRSRSTGNCNPPKDPAFPLIQGVTAMSTMKKYRTAIPEIFHPYISYIKDVTPDGHCGFRATAVGLGLQQGRFREIRKQLLLEAIENHAMWLPVFDTYEPGDFEKLITRIDYDFVGIAPREHWMEMPETGLLIAEKFGVIVHTLDTRGCDTSFPLTLGPEGFESPHHVVAVAFVNGNHFIHVKLEGDYPMPPPNNYWRGHHRPEAEGWLELYHDRIEMYRTLTTPTIDLNVYDVG